MHSRGRCLASAHGKIRIPRRVCRQPCASGFWYIFVAGSASGNKRMYAQMEMLMLNQRRRRPGVLLHFAPCLIHIVHRCIIPVMKVDNMIGDMFRSAHVLATGSYWQNITVSLKDAVSKGLIVLHNAEQSIQDRKLAEHILELTLLEATDGSSTKSRFVRLRLLRDELLHSSIGNWASASIRYRCQLPGCHGQKEQCRHAAVTRATLLILRSVFDRRISIPSLSRWWKFLPLARMLCMGNALHSLLAAAAPLVADGEQANAAVDDNWRAVHSFRVRKTAEFLRQPGTTCTLLLILQAMRPAHIIMSWLMSHEADTKRLKAIWQPEEQQRRRSRLAVACEFVTPAQSPLWSALEFGHRLLLSDSDLWLGASAFNPWPPGAFFKKIVLMVLPVLARIWWRGVLYVESWPVKLLRVLDPDAEVRRKAAAEFVSLKPCCTPRGVRCLRASVDSAAGMEAPEVLNIIREFGSQLDFRTS